MGFVKPSGFQTAPSFRTQGDIPWYPFHASGNDHTTSERKEKKNDNEET